MLNDGTWTSLIAVISGVTLLNFAWPIFVYFRDASGLRKYATQNWLSGVTPLAYVWEMGRGDKLHRSKRLYDLHQKNGSIIRLAPDWLSFSTSAAVKPIYGQKSPLSKSDLYYVLQKNGQNLVNITSKAYHSERRHLVAASYGPRNYDLWENKIHSLTEDLLVQMDGMCTPKLKPEQLPAKQDLLFDGNRWSLLYALDCMGMIGVSADLGFVKRGTGAYEIYRPDGTTTTVHPIENGRGQNAAVATLVWDTARFPMLAKMSGYISSYFAKAWTHGDHWRDFLVQLLHDRTRRFDTNEPLDDLIGPLLQNVRTGHVPNVTEDDKVAELDQMFTGSIDGIGSSLVNTLYYLVKHPEAMQRARAELDEALGAVEGVAPWSKVRALPYLKACIDEAQRLAPSVAGDLPRRTPPETPYTIGGVTVPGNTLVSISAYTAQRDPDIFPDPEAFKPERWLAKGEDQLKRMLDVYIVFTMGSRMCMGKSVTTLVQTICLSTLLRRYDFALKSPDWELEWTEYFNMWPHELPLKVWRREK